MFRRVVLVSLFLAVSPAVAESVRVFSGEHPDFSRLVFVFDGSIGWSQRRTSKGFEVTFDRGGLTIDLGRVFDKIPRTRVQGVAFDADSSTIRIATPRNTGMDVIEAGKNTIAMDLRTTEEDVSDGMEVAGDTTGASVFPFGIPSEPSALFTTPFARNLVLPVSDDLAQGASSDGPPDRQVVRDLEQELVRQLGRAASQGVATIAPDGAVPAPHPIDPEVGEAAAESHIASRTVFDAPGEDKLHGDGDADSDRQACIDASVLDIEQWPFENAFAETISAARNQLLTELDQPSMDGLLVLVRSYLSFGLGAEARSVIEELGKELPDRDVLLEVAAIVDDLPQPTPILAQSQECDGPAMSWAFLGQASPDPLDAEQQQRVKAWFLRLPEPLRTQLGPRLIAKLQTAGHSGTAESVRGALSRSASQSAAPMRMLEAETAISDGDLGNAISIYTDVVRDGDDLSAPALVEMLSTARSLGKIDPEAVLNAEALAFEFRGTPEGADLLAEATRSWTALSRFDDARRVLKEVQADSENETAYGPLLSEYINGLIAAEMDGHLISLVTSEGFHGHRKSLDRGTILSLASWLVENGLLDAAGHMLASYYRDDSIEVRQVRAKLALAKRDPSLALSLLAAEEDAESLRLRAEALSRLGDHVLASELFGAAMLEEDVRREQLLAKAQTLGSPAVTAAKSGTIDPARPAPYAPSDRSRSDASTDQTEPFDQDQGDSNPIEAVPVQTMSSYRNLLSESRAARDEILSILEDTRIVDGG